ncbi:hypothetical protein ACFPIJ_36515 [Dactylosporangium cerinum]|uniref:Uncharacterized protein n=1 Tax=Dactylosporangium cerinum TaxID=1434730 RepID=A0ABV9W6I3_9ACTN
MVGLVVHNGEDAVRLDDPPRGPRSAVLLHPDGVPVATWWATWSAASASRL